MTQATKRGASVDTWTSENSGSARSPPGDGKSKVRCQVGRTAARSRSNESGSAFAPEELRRDTSRGCQRTRQRLKFGLGGVGRHAVGKPAEYDERRAGTRTAAIVLAGAEASRVGATSGTEMPAASRRRSRMARRRSGEDGRRYPGRPRTARATSRVR